MHSILIQGVNKSIRIDKLIYRNILRVIVSCSSCNLIYNTLRKSLQTMSALSATSKQCFEQPAASFLVCSLISIEYNNELSFKAL